MADLTTTLLLLGISYLIGYGVADYLIRSRWGARNWLWLSAGEKFGFYTWPRPPANVVRLITVDGRSLLFYNVNVKEQKNQVEIDTPIGRLVAPEKASAPLPLTAIYVPGLPNPMSLVVYVLGGIIAGWLVFYYGYLLFMGLKPDAVFATLALVYMLYIYMWYRAASSSAMTEYHEYIATGIAPPYIHAIPSPNFVSPIRMAKYLNMPILIRVTDGARRALEHLKRALGVESDSQVAELLASAEFADVIMRKAVDLKVESERVAQAFRSFAVLSGLPRIRLGTGILLVVFLIIGILIGYLMGGQVVVGPPPAYNASLGGGVP